jgi:hypothetical protein
MLANDSACRCKVWPRLPGNEATINPARPGTRNLRRRFRDGRANADPRLGLRVTARTHACGGSASLIPAPVTRYAWVSIQAATTRIIWLHPLYECKGCVTGAGRAVFANYASSCQIPGRDRFGGESLHRWHV